MNNVAAPQAIGTVTEVESTRLFRGGALFLAASAFGNGLGYLFGIMLARILGPHDFGLYAVGMAVFTVVTLMTLSGGDIAIVKFVSQYTRLGDYRQAARTVVAVLAVSALAGMFVAGLLALLASPVLAPLFGHAELGDFFVLVALAVPLALMDTVLLSVLQALQRFREVVLIRYIWEPMSKLALAAFVIALGWGLRGLFVAMALTLLVSVVIGVRFVRELVGAGWHDRPFAKDVTTPVLQYCAPLLVTTVVGVLAPRTDVLFLGVWMTPEDVGLYQAAYQTAAIMALIGAAFDSVFAPMSAGLLAKADTDRLADLYRTVARWSLMASLPLVLLMVVFASEILSLFGPTFAAGMACLMLLAAGQWVSNWTSLAHTVLLMSGYGRLVMVNTLIGGGLFIGLNWLLIPIWGITGAAVAVAFSMTVGGLLRAGQVWFLHGLQPFSVELVKPCCAGVAAIAAGYWLKEAVGASSILVLALGSGLLYVGLLFVMKLEKTDRLALVGLLQRVRRA
jgi:O-antigen/teichoic acid export membrane protein